MKGDNITYQMPYIGCLLGTAYQKLLSQLDYALNNAGLDITSPEYLILRALFTRDSLQQCEIGDMVGKDKGAISRTVSRMVRKGLVITDAVSHKCTVVSLTPLAKSLEQRVMAVADARHKALLTIASLADIDTMTNVLKSIINN